MASPKSVEICVVAKTYGGAEGQRVYAGTRFAVGKDVDGLKTITRARYDALRQNNIVRPLGEEDTVAAPGRVRYGADFIQKTEGEGTGVTLARNVRQAAKVRARQSDNPIPPAPLKPQRGSQTGAAKPSASSAAAPASSSSTSGSRGNRAGSKPSSSTTLTR